VPQGQPWVWLWWFARGRVVLLLPGPGGCHKAGLLNTVVWMEGFSDAFAEISMAAVCHAAVCCTNSEDTCGQQGVNLQMGGDAAMRHILCERPSVQHHDVCAPVHRDLSARQ
jgi:hypothetical protein